MKHTTTVSKTSGQGSADDFEVQAPPLVRGYEVVIGFETHAQLRTQSKIFSRASSAFGSEPNTQASAVDVALPGTLPVMNKEAVAHAIRLGLAVDAHIAPHSVFARKNYFYPDLPKGYQISQFELPVVEGGNVSFWLNGQKRSVRLVRAHLEEDAGKSLHEDFFTEAGGLQSRKVSGIDLNRAGTPLLEIVTEPDMRSSDEAVEYAKALHTLVVWLGICDGNMQEGSFRCDANVSIRRPGQALGTRREIKNLNSFRFLKQAIDFEVLWQIEELEEGRSIEQATVLFNPETGETRAMRSKEDSADYRYFPDPDLPPLRIGADWIQQIRDEMPELPERMALRLEQQYAISAYDAAQLTQSRDLVTYFEKACAYAENAEGEKNKGESSAKLAKLLANWLLGEFAKRLNAQGLDLAQAPVTPAQLAGLVQRIADATISNAAAKQVLDALWTAELGADADVDAIIEAKNLRQMNDSTALAALVETVLQNNPKSVQEFLGGKDKALNALVGQVMKASKGQANPGQVMSLLRASVMPADKD